MIMVIFLKDISETSNGPVTRAADIAHSIMMKEIQASAVIAKKEYLTVIALTVVRKATLLTLANVVDGTRFALTMAKKVTIVRLTSNCLKLQKMAARLRLHHPILHQMKGTKESNRNMM